MAHFWTGIPEGGANPSLCLHSELLLGSREARTTEPAAGSHRVRSWDGEGEGRRTLRTISSTCLLSCRALRETLSSEPPRDPAFLGKNNSPHFT